MFRRFRYSMQRFMYGRYGNDRLNLFLICGAFILLLIGSILYQFKLPGLYGTGFGLRLAADAMIVWAIIRFLSRNYAARQRENQWLLRNWRNLTDRKNRYFQCPKCHQTVRVPRGRGKICIRCPKCNEKFVQKS